MHDDDQPHLTSIHGGKQELAPSESVTAFPRRGFDPLGPELLRQTLFITSLHRVTSPQPKLQLPLSDVCPRTPSIYHTIYIVRDRTLRMQSILVGGVNVSLIVFPSPRLRFGTSVRDPSSEFQIQHWTPGTTTAHPSHHHSPALSMTS